MRPPEALIFNIQRCSVHDGPGIRTVIFFKGCSLKCLWCSNPESVRSEPDIAWKASSCIGCRSCLPACPRPCLSFAEETGVTIDRTMCDYCGQCVNACSANALSMFGKKYTVQELFDLFLLDTAFFARSGGGVTLSGGEPLLQPEFAARFLHKVRGEHFSTCIETCGNYAYTDAVDEALHHTDVLFFDIKHVEPAPHKKYTGCTPTLAMENLRAISARHPRVAITVRTPVIPGFNDSAEAMTAIARFVSGVPTVRGHELLAYHNFGESKYAHLGRAYPLAGVPRPTKAHMEYLSEIAHAGAHTLVP